MVNKRATCKLHYLHTYRPRSRVTAPTLSPLPTTNATTATAATAASTIVCHFTDFDCTGLDPSQVNIVNFEVDSGAGPRTDFCLDDVQLI